MPTNKPEYKNQLRAKYKALGLCATCGKEREESRGTRVECETCAAKRQSRQKKEYHQEYYHKSSRKEKAKAQHVARKEQGLCCRCGKTPPVKEKGLRCQACIDIQKKQETARKDAAFNAYGGYKCNCCGETIKQFLSIDHINNDGAKHRKELTGDSRRGGGNNLYIWLKRNKYPAGFQVLCMNCNCGKYRNGGVCPHKTL